jgi:hypothetical protein
VEVAASSFCSEACAQLAIGGDSAGDEDPRGAKRFLCSKGLADQIANDCMLKACYQVEGLWIGHGESIFNCGLCRRVRTGEQGFAAGFRFGTQVVKLDVAKDCRLDARKREEEMWIEIGDGRCSCGLGPRWFTAEVELGLDLRKRERDGAGVAVLRQCVDPRATGVAEAEKFGYLVVGFSSGVI